MFLLEHMPFSERSVPMAPMIRLATTDAEREAIYKLRYDVYV